MSNKNPKIVIFPSDKSGCGWMRCLLPAAIMQEKEKLNITVSFNPTHEIMELGQIFIWQRQYKSNLLKLAKEYSHKKHIFELDDNLLAIAPDNPSYKAYQDKSIKENLYKFIQFCDHVTCSTEPLKDELSKYNKNVTVLPNSILPEFARKPNNTKDTIRVGWQGSAHHYNDLKFITNALVEVCNTYPNVQIVWMGWLPEYIKDSIPSDRLEVHGWVDFQNYYDKLRSLNIDIGLAPLEDNKFNKSKSALRYYENSLMGSCTIASNVYPYTNAINSGTDGIIVQKNRHKDWLKALKSLIENTDLRQTLAVNAQNKVLTQHNLYTNITKWIDVYDTVDKIEKRQTKPVKATVDSEEVVVDTVNGQDIRLIKYLPKLADQETNILKHRSIKTNKIKRILLLKLDHIGDFVLSFPAIKLVRKKYPLAEVTLVVASWNYSLAKRIEEVDNVLTFDFFNQESEKGIDSETAMARLVASTILDKSYDLAIDLRRHLETRQILIPVKARYKVGYATGNPDTDSHLTTAFMPPQEHAANSIVMQMYELVNQINKNIITDVTIPELKFTDEEVSSINNEYRNILKNSPVAVSVSSGTAAKEWGDTNFTEVITGLVSQGIYVTLLGSKKDVERTAKICEIVNSPYLTNIAGELPIDELVVFLKSCSLYIGNDSGVGHIAGMLNIPTFIIFHGIVSSSQWHPFGSNTYTFNSSLPCQPCFNNTKPHCPTEDCLQVIKPVVVQTKIIEYIKENK